MSKSAADGTLVRLPAVLVARIALRQASDAIHRATIAMDEGDAIRGGTGSSTGRAGQNPVDPIELCYEFTGIVGIHPDGRTLRELFMMASGKAKFLGATSTVESMTESIPYNPAMLQAAARAM